MKLAGSSSVLFFLGSFIASSSLVAADDPPLLNSSTDNSWTATTPIQCYTYWGSTSTSSTPIATRTTSQTLPGVSVVSTRRTSTTVAPKATSTRTSYVTVTKRATVSAKSGTVTTTSTKFATVSTGTTVTVISDVYTTPTTTTVVTGSTTIATGKGFVAVAGSTATPKVKRFSHSARMAQAARDHHDELIAGSPVLERRATTTPSQCVLQEPPRYITAISCIATRYLAPPATSTSTYTATAIRTVTSQPKTLPTVVKTLSLTITSTTVKSSKVSVTLAKATTTSTLTATSAATTLSTSTHVGDTVTVTVPAAPKVTSYAACKSSKNYLTQDPSSDEAIVNVCSNNVAGRFSLTTFTDSAEDCCTLCQMGSLASCAASTWSNGRCNLLLFSSSATTCSSTGTSQGVVGRWTTSDYDSLDAVYVSNGPCGTLYDGGEDPYVNANLG